MGTTYSIIVPGLKKSDQRTLQSNVEASLSAVNAAMSTYQTDSAISNFNRSATTHWIEIPEHFAVVANAALQIAVLSDGAFDPTVGPLVTLWGFGKDQRQELPETDEIAELRLSVGHQQIAVDVENPSLKKLNPSVQIDLNAIAKGYAVDLLAEDVASLGYKNYLVEIGGELRAAGNNAEGDPWRIGIEQPVPGKAASGLYLTSGGVATSGDYRNVFEQDGRRYSHIIDPRSGYPVDHSLASVTVVADTAMLADAWATTLMVLGPDDGMKIADQMELAAYFIVRTGPQAFSSRSSDQFEKLELR